MFVFLCKSKNICIFGVFVVAYHITNYDINLWGPQIEKCLLWGTPGNARKCQDFCVVFGKNFLEKITMVGGL